MHSRQVAAAAVSQHRFVLAAALSCLLGGPAAAEDLWGCEVLLCLSDPKGPTATPACVPPIQRLWKHLARGRDFPSCPQAKNPATGAPSYARLGTDYFDACPKGTAMVAEGRPPTTNGDSFDPGMPRLCGGAVVASRTVCEPGDGGCLQLPVYDALISLSAYAGGGVVDLFVGDAWFSRVRWQDAAYGAVDDPARRGAPVPSGICVAGVACAR